MNFINRLWLLGASLALLAGSAFAAPNRSDKFYIKSADGNEVVISSRGALLQRGSFAETNSLSSSTVNGTLSTTGFAALKSLRLSVANSDTAYSLFASSAIPRAASFAVITSSGGAITLTSTPTIATTTATTGDIFVIMSATATVTLSDNDSAAGTLLELGATTRALGVGDILALVYRSGKWWELFLANN